MLQCHIVDDIVVGALQEGGVNRHEWMFTRRSQSSGECNSMSFRDSYIECAFRISRKHLVHRRAAWHSRRDAGYLLMLAGKLHQCLAEYFLPFRARCGRLAALSGLRIELAGCMPGGGVFLGHFITLSLHCV